LIYETYRFGVLAPRFGQEPSDLVVS
jgi:hypothetical protein